MKRRGYTMMELVMAIFCITVVTAIAASLMSSAFKYNSSISKLSDNAAGKTNVIVVLEEALCGVEDVSVENNVITITSSKGTQVIDGNDFMSVDDLEIHKTSQEYIEVIIDGGTTWIPIVREQ